VLLVGRPDINAMVSNGKISRDIRYLTIFIGDSDY
jgi:hypothetical protein